MKQLIKILLITLLPFMVGCGWSEKNHQVSAPYTLSGSGNTENVPVKWDTGYRKVPGHYNEAGKWIPQQYVKDSVQPSLWENRAIKYVDVSPGRESVFKAAKGTGWYWQIGLGILIIIGTVIYAIKKVKKEAGGFDRGEGTGFTRSIAIGIIIGLVVILVNPISKSGNNNKRIRQDQYEQIIKTDPNLIKFFDSTRIVN